MQQAEQQLYEYAIVLKEKRDRDDEVVEEAEVLVKPTTILARGDSQAQMIAARAIPEEHAAHLDRVVVAIRPF